MRPPVAVGAVGGSGTRVVARILEKLGYFIGSDLNPASDNLWFSLLFRRPRWYQKIRSENRVYEIDRALELFYSTMRGEQIDEAEIGLFDAAYREGEFDLFETHDPSWYQKRRMNLMKAHQQDRSKYIGWAWKEPNTHIYLPELKKHDGNLKYIHVLRHGLDMAFSDNQQQLIMWGDLVDIATPPERERPPAVCLDYWIRINQRSVRIAQELYQENFLLVHFDKLCLNKTQETERILDFLELNADPIELSRHIVAPVTIGRYRQHDINLFRDDQIDAVRAFGFDCD